jgi:hypothetical protein
VGDPTAPKLDAAALFRILDAHGVRYVVVGGLAATAHGATRVTFDVDLVPEWSDSNLGRLVSALRELGAELSVADADEPVRFAVDVQALRQFEVSTWRTRAGDLDVTVGIPTTTRGILANYEALAARADERMAFGVTMSIASLDDIIDSKEALGREPDLVALPELHRLRATRRRTGTSDR